MTITGFLKSFVLITFICSIYLLFACPDLFLAIMVGIILYA